MLKRFEKLQYMVIGAVLMAVGIGIGSLFTQPLVAQRGDVFDEIICRRIVVVDENSRNAILLASDQGVNGLTVFDDKGKASVALSSTPLNNNVIVYNRDTTEEALRMASDPGVNVNGLSIYDDKGKKSIFITSQATGNFLNVYDVENDDLAIEVASGGRGSAIGIYGIGDKAPVVSLGYMPERSGITINNGDGSTLVARIVGLMNKNLIEIYDENGHPAAVIQGESGDNYLGVYDRALSMFYRYTGSKSPIGNPSMIVGPE